MSNRETNPNPHADLIERVSGHLARLDKEATTPGVGDQLLRHEYSTNLLRSAVTALRTSYAKGYADGWHGAADKMISDEIANEYDLDDFAIVYDVAEDLRRNAPQEAPE